MNTDKHVADIERMARAAGMDRVGNLIYSLGIGSNGGCEIADLARFAALVRADALEDAAKVCEVAEFNRMDKTRGALACAAAIRALASDTEVAK